MNDFEIKVVKTTNLEIMQQCIDIVCENLVVNGGTLKFPTIIYRCQYIICAVKDDKVLGFAGMVKNFAKANDFYIMQIAVHKPEMGKGIGSALMEYLIHHSRGFDYITSNAEENNVASNNLHLKMGFEQFKSNSGYFYILPTEKIRDNAYIHFTEEEKENEDI